MNLSILIPTVNGREAQFEKLYDFISSQIGKLPIEILHFKDNKQLSIGTKRNELYKMARGLFSVMIDDDDMVSPDYCQTINEVIESNQMDCIGYFESCLINGEKKKSVISLKCKEWQSHESPVNGFHFNRNPFFKVPIKTDICQKVGVKDMRYAEDHDFAIRIYPHLQKEYFIYKEMYFYSANSLTATEHKNRYGIK